MIRMIAGVFGLPVKGIVKAMDKNSDPFSASPEQEERLIRLGLAVRVEDPKPVQDEVVDMDAPIGFDEMPPEDYVEDEIIDLKSLSAKELREVGAEYGLTFKANASKVSMVKAITEAQIQASEDTDDAPVFDATEAVM